MRLQKGGAWFIGFIIAVNQFGCSRNSSRVWATLSEDAALAGDIPENPLRSGMITSTIDRSDSTMATSFGNDLAVEHATSHSQQDDPAGSLISLMTWTQREDLGPERDRDGAVPLRLRAAGAQTPSLVAQLGGPQPVKVYA